jgi:hypothetical protein
VDALQSGSIIWLWTHCRERVYDLAEDLGLGRQRKFLTYENNINIFENVEGKVYNEKGLINLLAEISILPRLYY